MLELGYKGRWYSSLSPTLSLTWICRRGMISENTGLFSSATISFHHRSFRGIQVNKDRKPSAVIIERVDQGAPPLQHYQPLPPLQAVLRCLRSAQVSGRIDDDGLQRSNNYRSRKHQKADWKSAQKDLSAVTRIILCKRGMMNMK